MCMLQQAGEGGSSALPDGRAGTWPGLYSARAGSTQGGPPVAWLAEQGCPASLLQASGLLPRLSLQKEGRCWPLRTPSLTCCRATRR